MGAANFLAIDMGASNVKAVMGKFNGKTLRVEEIHRFDNIPVTINGLDMWDILFLYRNVWHAIRKALDTTNGNLASVGIDSWGVDFGLIDRKGFLIGNPLHYRNPFRFNVMEKVIEKIGKWEIFKRCPAQFRAFNTLYQLEMIKEINPEVLERAESLLNIPSLITYFLTREKKAEFTMATTTQLYNPTISNWDSYIIERAEIPHILPQVIDPCTVAGETTIDSKKVKIVFPATHDTGSAFASVPYLNTETLVMSSGTWIPIGMVNETAQNTIEAMEADLANEGCIDKRFRVLTNMTGLWLIQEVRRNLNERGKNLGYSELIEMAQKAKPFSGFFDVDHPRLQKPGNMIEAIIDITKDTSGYVPQSIGEIIRISLESLALKVVEVKSITESVLKRKVNQISMLGGGVKNRLLCQLVSDATGLPVRAGPVEGAAIGNIIGQMLALGYISNLKDASDIIRASFDISEYKPQRHREWGEFVQSSKIDRKEGTI